MRTIMKLGGFSALTASLLLAAQPWDKASAGWTSEDVERLLTSSPWAQQAGASMEDPREKSESTGPPANPGVTPSGLAGSNNTGERWDGGVGRPPKGRLPTIPVTVRWESALPVREALQHKTAGVASANSGPAADYVISVSGLVPIDRFRARAGQAGNSSRSGDSTDPRNAEEMLEAFMSASRLRLRGEPDIRPENVKLDPATGEVRIYFPRSRPIEGRHKDVLFVTRFGGLAVEVKFHLAAMKYQGKLEL